MENYKTIRPKIKVVVVAYEKCSLIREVVTIGLWLETFWCFGRVVAYGRWSYLEMIRL